MFLVSNLFRTTHQFHFEILPFVFLASLASHDFIGEFSTSYRELSRGQSQFNVYEVSKCVSVCELACTCVSLLLLLLFSSSDKCAGQQVTIIGCGFSSGTSPQELL